MSNTFKKRIDELGRVVIPKQVRNTLKIDNFDELDIYIQDNSIILKKGNGLYSYKDKFDRLLNFLKSFCSYDISIVLKNKIISSNSDIYLYNDEIILDLEQYANKVSLINRDVVLNKNFNCYCYIEPIILDSNKMGYIFITSKDSIEEKLSEIKEIKTIIIDLIS
ncbi:MAG: hypothetical protein IJD92_05060 [Bacilli bacterium]|nr:hypothetical protein [Bacilli bacterium]